MAIIRWWDTTREINDLHHHMNRIFGETLGAAAAEDGTWNPAVDIFETEQEIVLKAEVPGLTNDQVNVEVDEGTLHLKGERKIEKDVNEENCHRIERAYGSFHRAFILPDYVDPEKVRAELKEGVLDIRLGKREQAKPKQIQVN